MPSAFQIRTATPNDATAIHRLICALASYERVDPATTVKATPASLAAQLASEHPPFHALVAECDGEVVGFALYFLNFSTWSGLQGIYLEDLFVEPRVRGLGIGKALFLAVAQVATSRGLPRMDWAVLDWNQPARDFYVAHGARCLDEWRMHRLDAAALAKLAAQESC